MSKKPKNKKAPKKTVVEDEKDKAIREMGEAARAYGCRIAAPTNIGECGQRPASVVEVQTGDKDSDDILKKINAAINVGGPPITVSVTTKAPGKPGYYWQFWEGEQQMGIGGPVFAITPKAYFDENGCLDDSHFEGETDDIPEGFSNLMESMFEYDGTREQAEAILKANPLFEERGIVHIENEGEEE